MDNLQNLVREEMQAADQNTRSLPVAQAKGPLIQR